VWRRAEKESTGKKRLQRRKERLQRRQEKVVQENIKNK
jgi:hypothetical protein